MPAPLTAPMPPDLELDGNYTIRLTAVDPTTGAVVSGVTVSNLAMQVVDLTGQAGQGLDIGPYLLVPGSGA